jgi:hypothetical protein
MTNPERLLAHCLPLWSVRGVADWAIWSGDSGDLTNGLAHGAGTVTVLLITITGASAFRLRVHPPHTVLPTGTQTMPHLDDWKR